MGWGNCGEDSRGRPIGYNHPGTCDYPGCGKPIHRGLDNACGGMHGDGDDYCDEYFCSEHLYYVRHPGGPLCPDCAERWEKKMDGEATRGDR